MALPEFRYHPDPVWSGSVIASAAPCRCCGQARGHIYTGPAYSEEDLTEALCPWCIADGSAQRKFEATFVDIEAFPENTPESAVEEISQRTPGYNAWQAEHWPSCCDDGTAFIGPAGIAEIREHSRELEGGVLNYIIYEMGISGGAATRLLGALDRNKGPTAYLFRCLHCQRYHFHIDQP